MTAFSATFNFRDVGGYSGLGGQTVRWQRLYRSDSLHRLDEVDREAFTALGIRTVIDLRRPAEVTRDGRVPAYDGLVYQHLHPEHRAWEAVPYDERIGVARYLADRYLDLTETGAAGIAAAVGVISEAETAPLVVHCVAGKDRTGIVCALTLSLLGVDDADIAADYALTAASMERFNAWFRKQLSITTPAWPPFLASPAETMLLFLTELRQRHGSVQGYLRQAGLSADQCTALRAHLLN